MLTTYCIILNDSRSLSSKPNSVLVNYENQFILSHSNSHYLSSKICKNYKKRFMWTWTWNQFFEKLIRLNDILLWWSFLIKLQKNTRLLFLFQVCFSRFTWRWCDLVNVTIFKLMRTKNWIMILWIFPRRERK